MAERKFTDEQEVEICDEYLSGDYTMKQLAEKYGCSTRTIWQIIHRSGCVEEMEKRASMRSKLALIKMKFASAEAADKLVVLLNKQRSDKQVYADIQIIQQVLDRAGVREQKEEKQEVNIKFNTGGIKLGVPDHSQDKKA